MPLEKKPLKCDCLHIMQRCKKQIFFFYWEYELSGDLKSIFIVIKEEEAFCRVDRV